LTNEPFMPATVIAKPETIVTVAAPAAENAWRRCCCQAIWAVSILVALEALFSIPLLSVETARPGASALAYAVSFGIVLGVCFGVRFATPFLRRSVVPFPRIRPKMWICAIISLGLVVRLLWVMTFPTLPRSDTATYVGLAYKLYRLGEYSVAGTYAYWPPGYPFFLFAHFKLFGPYLWVAVLANCWLYAATVVVVYVFARRLAGAGAGAARIAMLIIALWPNYIFSAGLASKETLLVLLLPLSIYLVLRAHEASSAPGRIGAAFAAGLVFGMASLTQPSTQLLVVPVLVFELLALTKWSNLVIRMMCIALGMAIVIGPWTVRNFHVFNRWVPISTNGGSVFYRANNPSATGGYIREGEYSLEWLPEIEWSSLGYKLGVEWIRSYPLEFVSLVGRKQKLFLGDDANGAYETLRRGHEDVDSRYVAFKLICQLFWLGLWVAIIAGLWLARKTRLSQDPKLALMLLTCLCLFAVHSIFESGGKYHMPLIAFLSLLAALPFFESGEVKNL